MPTKEQMDVESGPMGMHGAEMGSKMEASDENRDELFRRRAYKKILIDLGIDADKAGYYVQKLSSDKLASAIQGKSPEGIEELIEKMLQKAPSKEEEESEGEGPGAIEVGKGHKKDLEEALKGY